MIDPDPPFLGFEVALSDDSHETQWTETTPRFDFLAVRTDEEGVRSPKMVTVRVKDVIDALVGRSTVRPFWLSDFGDDPISITEDLFEVLMAYRSMRRAA